MNIKSTPLLSLLLITVLSACSTTYEYVEPPAVNAEKNSPMVLAAYDAIDSLLESKTQGQPIFSPNGSSGVLVGTISDINNLQKSSAFGRLVTEQLSSRLAQKGIEVSEIKLRGNLFVVKNEGEFLLTRELKEIGASVNADLVLVGTYADAGGAVYVTLKLVRTTDSKVINAYNYSLLKTEAIKGLLAPISNNK